MKVPDSAEYCAYCGSPRAASLENAREFATKSAAPHTQNTGIFTSYGEGTRVFPVVVPIVLRLSEAAVRVVGATIGVLAGVICSGTIDLVADPSSITGKLVN